MPHDTERQRRAEKEFLSELEELEVRARRDALPEQRPLPPDVRERRKEALRRVDGLAGTHAILFLLLVLPGTFLLFTFTRLASCDGDCAGPLDGAPAALLLLVPVLYVVHARRGLRRLRRRIEEDPAHADVVGPASTALGVGTVLLLVLAALVMTCFGLLFAA